MCEALEKSIISSVKEIANQLLYENKMELVDLEYRREGRGKVLRLFIDKKEGVSVEDCAAISRELGTILDVNDVITNRYVLEVSSPGLRRPLKNKEDYIRFKDRYVLVKTTEPIQERKAFKGYLKEVTDNGISIEIEGTVFEIPFELIKKANLEIDF